MIPFPGGSGLVELSGTGGSDGTGETSDAGILKMIRQNEVGNTSGMKYRNTDDVAGGSDSRSRAGALVRRFLWMSSLW